MKFCSNCSASNADAARFCSECGATLTMLDSIAPDSASPAKSVAKGEFDARSLAKSISMSSEALQGKRKADIMFVLDCTGSMQGEINAIRDAITGFAHTIKSDGVRARVGLIEFRDRLIGEEHKALSFAGQPFTDDPALFKQEVSRLRAHGGGDEPESSLDAIMLALRQPFATDANKVIVLVTDAPPHIPDKQTRSIEEVCQAVVGAGIKQFYAVFRTQQPNSQIYLKLFEGTKGLAFELGKGDEFRRREDDFKKTLMSLGKTISASTT